MGQLPSGAVGVAVGVLIYSLVCLLASCVMIWLTWHHRERSSYIAFLAYFTLLSTACSITQQIHNIIRWREVIQVQFDYGREHQGSPELLISNSSVGPDLILFYIQLCSYNIEALLVMFWGWSLVQSVYHLANKPQFKHPLEMANKACIAFSICLPIITISCLQVPAVRSNKKLFLNLASLPLICALALGGLSLLLVFGRYVHSRRSFKRMNLVNISLSHGSNGSKSSHQRRSIYDQWLLIRFTIAFIVMAGFELAVVFFPMSSDDRLTTEQEKLAPDFSVERARQTFILYMPGVSPSLLVFVVFATTKPCIDYMKSCLGFRRNPMDEPMLELPQVAQPISSPTSSTYKMLKHSQSFQTIFPIEGEHESLHMTNSVELSDLRPPISARQPQDFASNQGWRRPVN